MELGLHVELAQDKLEVRRPSHARSACWIVRSLSTSSLPDQKGAVIAAMDCVEVAKDAWTAGEQDADKRSEASPFPIPPRTLSYRAPQACLHITHAGGKGAWYVPITWTGWTVDKEFRAVHEDQLGLSPPGSVADAEAGGRARTAPRYRRMLAPILDAPRCKPSLHSQDCGTRCGTTRMRRSRRRRVRRMRHKQHPARAAWNVSRQPAPSSWATGRPHPRPSFPVPSHAPCTHEHIAHLHSLREVHARCERENAHDNSHLRRSRVEGVTPCTL